MIFFNLNNKINNFKTCSHDAKGGWIVGEINRLAEIAKLASEPSALTQFP